MFFKIVFCKAPCLRIVSPVPAMLLLLWMTLLLCNSADALDTHLFPKCPNHTSHCCLLVDLTAVARWPFAKSSSFPTCNA